MGLDEFARASSVKSPTTMQTLKKAEEKERAQIARRLGSLEPIRLWLDDDEVDRAAPEGWLQVTTAQAAIAWLDNENVIALSLDHDLGDDDRYGRGIDVVNWLGEQQEVHDRPLWPKEGITLHTANPYGRDAMARAIRADAGRRFEVIEEFTSGNKPTFRMKPRSH